MEIYKDINGYEGLYQISNLGNVKSLRFSTRHPQGCIMKQDFNKHTGYCMIKLNKDKIRKGYSIHSLVANAFIENPDNKKYIDHINKKKKNNNSTNLRWLTNSENCRNITKRKTNKSGYRGVSWCKINNKWKVQINIGGTKKHLGLFDNVEDASECYENKYNEIMDNL